MNFCAELTNEDIASPNDLTAKPFYAASLGITVSTVL
jgi:hypothetical protein